MSFAIDYNEDCDCTICNQARESRSFLRSKACEACGSKLLQYEISCQQCKLRFSSLPPVSHLSISERVREFLYWIPYVKGEKLIHMPPSKFKQRFSNLLEGSYDEYELGDPRYVEKLVSYIKNLY